MTGFLSGGETPRNQDTNWTEAVRWLIRVQNNATTPDPANNPRRTDSLWKILKKIAAALNT